MDEPGDLVSSIFYDSLIYPPNLITENLSLFSCLRTCYFDLQNLFVNSVSLFVAAGISVVGALDDPSHTSWPTVLVSNLQAGLGLAMWLI